jgi:hypothetical protein
MIGIFDLYKDLKKEGVIFCFCGPTTQHIVEGIGETLRQRMELEGGCRAFLFSIGVCKYCLFSEASCA